MIFKTKINIFQKVKGIATAYKDIRVDSALQGATRLAIDKFEASRKPIGQRLNKASKACKYFGVDNPRNILLNFQHHKQLDELNRFIKTQDSDSIEVVSLGVVPLKDVDKTEILSNEKFSLIIPDKAKPVRAAKITFLDKIFGNGLANEFHTVGLVAKDDCLYVLDSLGEQNNKLREFHLKVNELFLKFGFKNIFFSTKAQQSFDEYTCNNWTYANINSFVAQFLRGDNQIQSSDDLNKILREDINTILKEQYKAIVAKNR